MLISIPFDIRFFGLGQFLFRTEDDELTVHMNIVLIPLIDGDVVVVVQLSKVADGVVNEISGLAESCISRAISDEVVLVIFKEIGNTIPSILLVLEKMDRFK